MRAFFCFVVGVLVVGLDPSIAWSETLEPVTLDTVVDPGPNSLDESPASSYSLNKAIHFLDSASIQWQKQRKCFTCHTNLAYLYARPFVSGSNSDGDKAHRTVRNFAEAMVQDRWTDDSIGPRWDAEVVAVAAALAFNDAHTTGSLHPTTRSALDRMWDLQSADGSWDWLKCGWPPMESDDHYGATIGAIAAGVAPDDYLSTPQAKAGMLKLKNYFAENAPPTLHHQAMLLWASSYHDALLSPTERQAIVASLFELQKQDGGWALASMGDWERSDDSEQDPDTSDGYGTGFALFVLAQSGVPSDDPRITHGIKWLEQNQRASGRWITRSLNKDSKHFISHAGTAFAVMALAPSQD